MAVVTHLSASQLTLYLQCSLKYRFHYVDQIEPKFKSSGLAFGGTIHSTLEWLHRQRIEGKPIAIEDLLRIFHADWFAQNMAAIRFSNHDDRESLLKTGEGLLALYLRELPQTLPKFVEYPFEIPLVHPKTHEVLDLEVKGVIDLIEEDGMIVDHKTSAKTMDSASINRSLQFTIYSYAYRYLFESPEKGIRIDNLIKTKQPKIERTYTERSQKDYIRLFHLAGAVLHGIDSAVFMPNPGWMCADCEYQEHCQNWQG